VAMHQSPNGSLGANSRGERIASHIIASVMNNTPLHDSSWSAKNEKVWDAMNQLT